MTAIEPVSLGTTVRMPFGLYQGMLLHDLPSDYIAVVLEYELEDWLANALRREWNRRVRLPKEWPVCTACKNTTDRLIGRNKDKCSRCAAKE